MKERIFYVDLFDAHNSNFYWRRAFAKLGDVQIYDCRLKNVGLADRIKDFAPTHIHLGSSVKAMRPVDCGIINRMRKEMGCTASHFFGDRRYRAYPSSLTSCVDLQFISSVGHVEQNQQNGVLNSRYMPCPTEPSVFYYVKDERIYDVVYVGWNTSQSACPELLDAIHEEFGMTVAGPRWGGTPYTWLGSAFNEEFSNLCGKTKIMLSPIPEYARDLKLYFSNRVANVLACKCFLIMAYTPGIEDIFTKGVNVEWYTSPDNLLELIDHYLKPEHAADRERIAAAGQALILGRYTFDRSAAHMIEECKKERDG